MRTTAPFGPITESYIGEALQTFNSGCYKATAVMVGAAAESIVLDIRDSLVSKLNIAKNPVPKDLIDWRISRVLKSVETVIKSKKSDVPQTLFERFDANWSAFTHQIRTARNDAGHPSNVDPVTPEDVHASLLIFPQLASLAVELKDWVSKTGAI